MAIHGGGTTAVYFDCPGHPSFSLLRTGAAAGFTVVALDRPGYGSSAPYPEAMVEPDQRVNLAYGAVDRIIGERPRGAGIFVMGHSGGCELTMRMAADERGADLLGIELAGTGRHYHPAAREMLKTATRERRPSGLRELLWHPERPVSARDPHRGHGFSDGSRLRGPDGVGLGAPRPSRRSPQPCGCRCTSASPSTKRFGRPMIQRWRRSPRCSPASPRFTVHRQPEAGHNISLGHTAADYHSTVLAFAEECVAASAESR